MNYSQIFRQYSTKENLPFLLLNKRVEFPSDKTLYIYDIKLVDSDTPWTILSYILYGTIEYWWILCSLNQSSIFYAKEGTYIYYIKPDYIDTIINSITSNI